MVKIYFTGAGQYWLSSPEPTDGTGGGALWIDLGECETEADVLAAVNEYEAEVLAAASREPAGGPRGALVFGPAAATSSTARQTAAGPWGAPRDQGSPEWGQNLRQYPSRMM